MLHDVFHHLSGLMISARIFWTIAFNQSVQGGELFLYPLLYIHYAYHHKFHSLLSTDINLKLKITNHWSW